MIGTGRSAAVVLGLLCAGWASGAERVTPVAAPFASGPAYPSGNPADKYAAERAIDGDPQTFCCLLDDTLTGSDENTMPPRAAAPATGHIVFDLGGQVTVVGATLTARHDGGPYNPQQVDFFCFADDDPCDNSTLDDLEHDPDLRPLLAGHTFGPLRSGESATVTWPAAKARYVGLRVNSSYESNGKHFNFQIGEIEFLIELKAGEVPAGVPVPLMYEKRATLIETMLESRRRCARWLGQTRPSGANRPPVVARRIESVWNQIQRDFLAAENPLLEYVPNDWLGADGWLTRCDAGLEQRLLRRALEELGPSGTRLGEQLEELVRSSAPADDPRWLQLCDQAASMVPFVRQFASLQASIEHLNATFPQHCDGKGFCDRLQLLRERLTRAANRAEFGSIREDLDALKYEALVRCNPLLIGDPTAFLNPEPRTLNPLCGKLLFVKRHTYRTGWYYSEFMQAGRLGGSLCVLSLADGQVTELLPALSGGIFDRYDLSFDGRRIVFGYRPAADRAFRLYEVGIDGQGLRQLTFDPPGEAARLASYGLTPGVNELGPWRGHSDDFHPCYLPDGGICFASSRCERGVLCDQADNLSVNVLYRIDGDGSNMQVLSQGALSESTPAVMNDGRILYTRWEYVDRGVIAAQDLWAMRPDGSASCEVYGSHHEFPPVLIHGRAIPGSHHQFVCTATMHHPFAVGPIVKIDTSRDIRTHAPIQNLTPDTNVTIEGDGGFPSGENYAHLRNGRWVKDNGGPLFCDPYPLSDKFFLVICNPDQPWNHETAYGIWLIDEFGNRVRIYHDPKISCWQPMPVRPRAVPAVVADAGQGVGLQDSVSHGLAARRGSPDPAETADRRSPALQGDLRSDAWLGQRPAIAGSAQATVVLNNVYEGLEGVERGEIKYLRIWEQVPRPWTAHRFWPDDATLGQNAVISLNAHIYVKVLHGIVPVEADGSAHFVVPADRNLFFQAIDEDFMEVQRMRTFVNLRPGESRSCIGCHEPRNQAPPHRMPLALLREPSLPGPQPGESVPRPLYYPTDIQPILDRHCVRCHGGEKTEGDLILTGELTAFFSRSYESLMNRKFVTYIQEFVGPETNAQKTNVTPLPPKALGSHASRLIQVLRQGHYEVALPREAWVRLVTWVDANGPYYGSYFGRRNLKYQGLPDFRPVPTLPTGTFRMGS